MTTDASRKVAVLMAVHQGADAGHFEAALASLRMQTHRHAVTYLYCDGPLTPAHEALIAGHLDASRGDAIVRGERSVGLAAALNALIDRALLDPEVAYFARMDADDLCVHTRFSEQIACFEQQPEVAILGTWCIEFTQPQTPLFHKRLPQDAAQVPRFMLYRSPLAHPSVMFRREVLASGHRYDPKLVQAQDYEFWSRLLCAGYRISNVPQYLLWYRLSPDFYARRTGWARAFAEFRMRLRYARASGQFRPWHLLGFASLFAIRMAPVFVKRWSYRHLRRA